MEIDADGASVLVDGREDVKVEVHREANLPIKPDPMEVS